jgi:hypothetical protein
MTWWNRRARTRKRVTRMSGVVLLHCMWCMRAILTYKWTLDPVHRMVAVLEEAPGWNFGPLPCTITHPQLRPYPAQIDALQHCRASHLPLTVGPTTSDVSAFQAGLKLPLARLRNHAAHFHPFLHIPSATTRFLELACVHCERSSTSLLTCPKRHLPRVGAAPTAR